MCATEILTRICAKSWLLYWSNTLITKHFLTGYKRLFNTINDMDKQSFEEWISDQKRQLEEAQRRSEELRQRSEELRRISEELRQKSEALRQDREKRQAELERHRVETDQFIKYFKQMQEAWDAQLFHRYSNRIKRKV